MKKKIHIGVSDFKKVIDGDYLYVDKTLLIEELLERGGEVSLIPRPRRFGKTLNLSMLRYFFEKSSASTAQLFDNLLIAKNAYAMTLQGRYPVIFITLKDVKSDSLEEAYIDIGRLIAEECKKHIYLLDGEVLSLKEKKDFQALLNEEGSVFLLKRSLADLTAWLCRFHKEKCLILIDEYDAPIHAAFACGFYDPLIKFMRKWLANGLKDNPYLERGVVSGVLRVAKESIFSGLNNLKVCTLLDEPYADKFGLTETEVRIVLTQYELEHKMDEIRESYNGYKVGGEVLIYNPWSVFSCIDNRGQIKPYWVNTSDNALINKVITRADSDLKADLVQLLNGDALQKTLEPGMVFSHLEKKQSVIWTLLLFSGYLTLDSAPTFENVCTLRIPNKEVGAVYRAMVLGWFEQSMNSTQYHHLLSHLVRGDVREFSSLFRDFFENALSVFDLPKKTSENLFHMFILGMLVGLQNTHQVRSNRESGFGRYDVMIIPKDLQALGIIFEFKKCDGGESVQESAQRALDQIINRGYDAELRACGIKKILHFGFGFEGKQLEILHCFQRV